jgi:hypothetical protein
MKTPKCDCCGKEEAAFFHSSCCGKHFEGVVKDGKLFIACEKCGKIAGEVKKIKEKK